MQKGQVTKLKIHLYRILGCMFYICDPKTSQNQEKTYFQDLGHGGAHTAFFRGCFGDLFEGTRTPMFDGFSRFRWAWSDSKLINTWMKLNWIDSNWCNIKSWHCTNRLTCLRALLFSESGFSRASLPFFSSSDLPVWGLTCGGPLLLSESAASSLFFSTGFLLFLPLGLFARNRPAFQKAMQAHTRWQALLWPCLPGLMALPVWDPCTCILQRLGVAGIAEISNQNPAPQSL